MVGESTFRKYIWFALIIFVLLTAYLGYRITDVRFDYDFEKFFPKDDETAFFMEFREKFNSENDFLLIAVERKKGVFDRGFLQEVDKLTHDLEKVDNVEKVVSLTNQSEFFIFPNGITSSKPYIDFNDFDPKRDSLRVFKNQELVNTLVSEHGGSLCIFLKHTDYLSKKKSDQLVIDIGKVMDRYDFEKVRIGGRTLQQKYYIDKMMVEMIFFVGMSAFLIVVFLLIAFRSIWGILIPQLIIVSSMVWVLGGMGIFNAPINIILTVLPTIMFVVSMSDVIHLVSRYLDALRVTNNTFQAITTAVKEVGLATLLTSVTTAIGFFSLYFVRIEPIQVFGLVMGFGVLLAFVLTFTMLPVMFYFFPGPAYVRKKGKGHFWEKFLVTGFVRIMHYRKLVLILTLIFTLVSIGGVLLIRSDNYLLDDLRDDEPLKSDFNFIDKEYGGVRAFELVVIQKDTAKTVWDQEFLQQMDSIEQYLRKEYGVTVKTSLVTVLKVANRSSHSGKKEYYELPSSAKKIRSFRRKLRMAEQGTLLNTVIDTTESIARISGNVPDIGNQAVTAKNEALFRYLKKHNQGGDMEFHLTGTAHLVDKNLKYLAISLIRGLGVSVLIVALIIGLIYRSFTIVLITMVTNLFPLLFIAGLMGFAGIELKTSTAIIFTIAFGIAVDDTIHFLGKFKYELLKGKGKLYALKRSYLTTGKAMILTTLILCAGFLLLIFSDFLGTLYLGVLMCITLFVALIADITLLPVLLLLFYRPKKRKA